MIVVWMQPDEAETGKASRWETFAINISTAANFIIFAGMVFVAGLSGSLALITSAFDSLLDVVWTNSLDSQAFLLDDRMFSTTKRSKLLQLMPGVCPPRSQQVTGSSKVEGEKDKKNTRTGTMQVAQQRA